MNQYYEHCQYCTKKLRTKQQKKTGFCNQSENLLSLHTKLDIIMNKLESEEHELDNLAFTVNPFALDQTDPDPDLLALEHELAQEEVAINQYFLLAKKELQEKENDT